MKLVGEVGEYIDLEAKGLYKPGRTITDEMRIDELGDIWYYLRIIAYICEITIEDCLDTWDWDEFHYGDPEDALFHLACSAANLLVAWKEYGVEEEFLISVVCEFNSYITMRGFTLDQITDANYSKLVSIDGKGIHGWKTVYED